MADFVSSSLRRQNMHQLAPDYHFKLTFWMRSFQVIELSCSKSIEIERITFVQASILISLTSIAIHSTNKTRFEAECDIRKKIYSNECLKIFISKNYTNKFITKIRHERMSEYIFVWKIVRIFKYLNCFHTLIHSRMNVRIYKQI